MVQDHIWNLIAKKLSGEGNEEELGELEHLLRENPELHYSLQAITDLWFSDFQFDQHEAQEAFKRHIERMQDLKIDFRYQQEEEESASKTSLRKNRFILWPALAVAITIGALFFGARLFRSNIPASLNVTKGGEKTVSQISTKNGSKTNLILPDGTKVWLNAGSSLSYDSSYGRNIREVALSGEAFFDVVKNKEKPFIIHASKINIKVLGTEFNVRSYPTDKTTEASLIRGSIEVTFKDKPNKKIILKPNEKIVVDNDLTLENIPGNPLLDRSKKINKVPGMAIKNLTYEYKTGAIIETSWVENKLIFQDESFEEIARQLERWYGVSIIFKNNQLKENHLTGSFKNETIRQALDALKFTASFKYEIDNNNNVTIL
ncbi:MAG TPA: FecR family protein [Puia sp.]